MCVCTHWSTHLRLLMQCDIPFKSQKYFQIETAVPRYQNILRYFCHFWALYCSIEDLTVLCCACHEQGASDCINIKKGQDPETWFVSD